MNDFWQNLGTILIGLAVSAVITVIVISSLGCHPDLNGWGIWIMLGWGLLLLFGAT